MLWQFMPGQRLRYGGAILAMLVGTLISYMAPQVGRVAIDYAVAGKPLEAPAPVRAVVEFIGGRSVLAQNLWLAGIATVLLTGLSTGCGFLRTKWSAKASESIVKNLRERLYDHLQHLPCTYHDKAETGDLVQRCTSDVETIRGFFSSQVVEISRAWIMLLTAVPLMLAMSVKMTLVSLASMPVIIVFAFVFFTRVKNAFKLSDEAEGRMTTVLQENLTGMRVVRAFARQDHECDKFASRNAEYRDRSRWHIHLLSWYWSSSDFICHLQFTAVLAMGGWWILNDTFTVGRLYAFIAYLGMMLWGPVRNMGRILSELGKAIVSMGRLHDILHRSSEPQEARADDGVVPEGALRGDIAVRNLTFAYEGSRNALDDVSLHIEAGRTLALLGPSGSGKSTLVHLLLRLYDYAGGSITIDGRELRGLDRKYVRSQMGVVMQEPFLYSKTLRENIRLGDHSAEDDEIAGAAEEACIHESIVGFEKGYDTLVGERGITLSGGQRQRVALARAILKGPPILLLDDALSAVDTRTESLILRALRNRRGKRTTVVIAHRLSTLMQADRIVVLEHGKVIQTGTHESLLIEEGLYRRLWQIQSSLEEDLNKEMVGK
jgi:ATP-binding cassette subfamily B protein